MSKRLRIVLADGDGASRNNLEQWLTDLGHRVLAVDGGRPLLGQCRPHLPDLIIADARLPDVDGIEAVAAACWQADIPVILLDDEWTPDSAHRGAKAGMNRRIAKPVRPLDLVNAMKGIRRGPSSLLAEFIARTDESAVVTLDPEGRVNSWNRGAELLFGLRAEAALGRHWNEIAGGGDEWRAEKPVLVGRIVPHSDRTWRWATGRVEPLGEDGKEGHGIILRDRTAAREEETLLQEEFASLRQAEADRVVQFGVLAHELRNQIGPLLNYAVLIRMRTADAETQEIAAKMDRSVRQMTGLINDLMDSARTRRGCLRLDRQRIDLREVVAAAVENMRPFIEGRAHKLGVNISAEPVWADGDANRLVRSVVNLLSNAAKYTPSGGRVDVTVAVEDDWGVIRVRDNGVGIPAGRLKSVFGLFDQDPRTVELSQGGLGLGLALVRDLINLHGGTVEAQSDGEGCGSEFVVRLPRCEE